MQTDPGPRPQVADLRGTPCDEFLAELSEVVTAARLGGYGIGLTLTRGQSLFVALGAFGVDPVLGPYTVVPDASGCDYELRCSAPPEVVAQYTPDWHRILSPMTASAPRQGTQ